MPQGKRNSGSNGIATLLSLSCFALLQSSAALAQDEPRPPGSYLISSSELFVYFFVMLGPIKLLTPFTRVTEGADEKLRHRLALRATMIAAVALAVAATLGTGLLTRWHVSSPALLLAAAAVLMWVAFRMITGLYAPLRPPVARGDVPAAPPPLSAAMAPIAFPGVVTPYGIALVILIVANAHDPRRLLTTAALLAAVLVLDLLAMWFARPLMKVLGSSLQLLGSFLGVLQVALAMEMAIQGLGMLGVVEAPSL